MAKVQSWEVSDEFWKRVEMMIPKPKRLEGKVYKRKQGAGRTPKDLRAHLKTSNLSYMIKAISLKLPNLPLKS